VARVDERIEVVTFDWEPSSSYRPDVLVGRFESEAVSPAVSSRSAGAATVEPELVEVLGRDPEEVRMTWVEIRSLPELELVTAIEVLSPINKSWQGRRAYLDKRDERHAALVNLVEIDLLLSGGPMPMKRPIAPGGYYAIVARGARRPMAEVYRWSVRDRLPSIPIPLREPDADAVIDLGELVTRVYDLGRYVRTLRRDRPWPVAVALTAEDRAWVDGR
jgi:hypothetical protein